VINFPVGSQHTSKLCKNYLQNLEKKRILKVMTATSQSFDLNPIEKLWVELDRWVRKLCLTLATHLLQDTVTKRMDENLKCCRNY